MAETKTVDQYANLSLDELLDLINPDFNIGKTYFSEAKKRFMISHNYSLIAEVNCEENDVDEWELFGYPLDQILPAMIPAVYGETVRDCTTNFLKKHPKLILK